MNVHLHKVLLAICFAFFINTGLYSQIPATCTSPLVDFSGFDGSGFTATPTAGQLSSTDWNFTGFSDAYTSGGSNTSGDFARGTTTGGETTGGIYALDVGGNQALWIQPGGSDFTPGTAELTVCNNSGSTMVDLDLSYDLLVLNNADRANSFNFSFSTDGGATFTNVPALDFTSPETADASPTIQTMMQSTTLAGVNLADGDCIILQWSGDDVSGGGSRDEFGLDNITICPTAPCAISLSLIHISEPTRPY